MSMISPQKRFALLNHRMREINRIYAFDLIHQPAADIARATSHIKHRSWFVDHQGEKQANSFVRIRRPIRIHLSNTTILELFSILQAKMSWFGLHAYFSSL